MSGLLRIAIVGSLLCGVFGVIFLGGVLVVEQSRWIDRLEKRIEICLERAK